MGWVSPVPYKERSPPGAARLEAGLSLRLDADTSARQKEERRHVDEDAKQAGGGQAQRKGIRLRWKLKRKNTIATRKRRPTKGQEQVTGGEGKT